MAVAPEQQGKGFGRMLIAEVGRLLQAAGCPKINLMVRSDNAPVIEFYQRPGYKVVAVVSLGKRLFQDGPDS